MSKPASSPKTKKKEESVEIKEEIIPVLYLCRKDGWFMLKEIYIPKDKLEKYGVVKYETLPEILAITLSQVTGRVRKIFDL